jgi:hypothetical protein
MLRPLGARQWGSLARAQVQCVSSSHVCVYNLAIRSRSRILIFAIPHHHALQELIQLSAGACSLQCVASAWPACVLCVAEHRHGFSSRSSNRRDY